MTQEPLWKPLVSGFSARRAACACRPDPVPLPVGCCEFVGDVVDEVVSGRRCFDGTYCPMRVFGDAAVFGSCPARLEKLKEQS